MPHRDDTLPDAPQPDFRADALGDLSMEDMGKLLEPSQPHRRFCSRCGSLVDVFSGRCGTCDATRSAAADKARIEVAGPDRLISRSPQPLKDVIGLYAVLLATFLVSAIGLWTYPDSDRLLVNLVIAVSILDAIVVTAWVLARQQSIGPLLSNTSTPAWLLGAAAMAIGTWGFATVFILVLTRLPGVEEILVTDGFREAGYSVPVIVVFCCVMPALFEELAFRGIIMGGLLSYLTRFETILVSAVMFMLIHLTAFGVPQLALGLLLAWMRLRTRSLWPCVVLHFTHNFLCVADELWWR